MMGLDHYLTRERTPLNVRTAQVHQRDGFRIEALSYESLPGLKVAGNLYIPHDAGPEQPAPAIVYVCGHSATTKVNYQDHPRRFAQLGFVTLIVDTIQLGEVRGYHHGTHRYGQFEWLSRGYTPAAVEVWNAVRALDLLQDHPAVDGERLGITGTSGGGAISWYAAAADDRIKAASPSCGTGTIASQVRDRTIDGHCDCMFVHNPDGWSLVEMAALIAPRPVLIVSPSRDGLFTMDSIGDFHGRLAQVYDHLDAAENLELFTFAAPHSYQPSSRRATYAWFLRHLMGEDVTPDNVDDVDGEQEEAAVLAAFPDAIPAGDRSTTVHDWFIPLAQAPEVATADELARQKADVVEELQRETFAAQPSPFPDPRLEIVKEGWSRSGGQSFHFRYTPEGDWRLDGGLRRQQGSPQDLPLMVELVGRDAEQLGNRPSLTEGVPAGWGRAWLTPRGTGSTGWNPAMDWHLRRAAALTGQTIASMRVLDVLQGLRALRSIEGVAPRRLFLAARGELAAVALYAALLDGDVDGLVLYDPPATQNAPDPTEKPAPHIEMLGCLRITDLPQVAGLLWPASLVFVGMRPETYLWAEDLYGRLGAPGGVWNVPALADWRPEPGQ